MSETFQRYPMWLHHPDNETPSKLVHDEDAEAETLAEWNVDPEEAALKADSFRDLLLVRANKAKLDVNPRWSDKRLQKEVEAAETPSDAT